MLSNSTDYSRHSTASLRQQLADANSDHAHYAQYSQRGGNVGLGQAQANQARRNAAADTALHIMQELRRRGEL